MANYQNFGIIYDDDALKDVINDSIDYTKDYNCIDVNDSLIHKITLKKKSELDKIPTFHGSLNAPDYELATFYITLIPPTSLEEFQKIIISENEHYKSKELELLISMISKAISEYKYMVHFGI